MSALTKLFFQATNRFFLFTLHFSSEVSCGRPNPIQNGAVTGSSFKYNAQIKYSCNTGYGLSGPPVRTCQLNGEWSGIAPTCLCKSE